MVNTQKIINKCIGKNYESYEPKGKEKYKKGDICWNCGKTIKNPNNHYPINSTMFCKEE